MLCERLLDRVHCRFRLSSIEATEIDDRLVALLRESGGQLAPHLHVPLQSGSDAVLRRMRRWHTREAYRTRLLDISAAVGTLGLGADIIVGFPGETDEQHAETRDLVQDLPYTYLHVFPYSVRDQTVAASLPDRVPGDIAAERSRELRQIGADKGVAYRRSRVGGQADLVVERAGSGADPAMAISGDYLRVQIRGDADAGDRFVSRLDADGDRLVAEGWPERNRPPGPERSQPSMSNAT